MNVVTIKVGMADLQVSKHPCKLTTLGLGSCVGIALYDPKTKITGLAHVMLPTSSISISRENKAKFADEAIEEMLYRMLRIGAKKSDIVAKIAGGAQMFKIENSSDIIRIGTKNVIFTKEKLNELGIEIVAEDTGGNYGRSIEFYSSDGKMLVKTLGHGTKYI